MYSENGEKADDQWLAMEIWSMQAKWCMHAVPSPQKYTFTESMKPLCFLVFDPYTVLRSMLIMTWEKHNDLNFLHHFGAKYYQFVTCSMMIKMLNTAYWWSPIMATIMQPLFQFQSLDTTGGSYNKSQRDALFLKFILIKNSTCFGQIYCPSSGVSTLYTQQ